MSLIPTADLGVAELALHFTPFDLKRLESYANNMLDYHVVADLLPAAASLYFQGRLSNEIRLSALQSSILLAFGLQRKTVEEIEAELQLPVSQVLAMFVKIIRKITKRLVDIQKAAIGAELPEPDKTGLTRVENKEGWRNVTQTLEQELDEAGDEATKTLRDKQRAMIGALDLQK